MADSRLEQRHYISFDPNNSSIGGMAILQNQCPHCQKIRVSISSFGGLWGGQFHYSYPSPNAMYLPDYIPEALRQDYTEAVQITDLSPKAAATLARRCLQGMIHDFWNIHEKNLNAEITTLKTKIPTKQWEAIDAIRKVGNIGAHMENDVERIVDVDPEEAKKLLKVIEMLFKTWYINQHEEETLCDEVKELAAEKEEIRSAAKNPDSE